MAHGVLDSEVVTAFLEAALAWRHFDVIGALMQRRPAVLSWVRSTAQRVFFEQVDRLDC